MRPPCFGCVQAGPEAAELSRAEESRSTRHAATSGLLRRSISISRRLASRRGWRDKQCQWFPNPRVAKYPPALVAPIRTLAELRFWSPAVLAPGHLARLPPQPQAFDLPCQARPICPA